MEEGCLREQGGTHRTPDLGTAGNGGAATWVLAHGFTPHGD